MVLRTPWDYVERPEAFLARVREIAAVTTLVNHAGLVAWNIHKRYLAELERAGVPVVPLALVARGAGAAARDAARTAFGDEIVIKPAISAGARGTIRVDAASERAAASTSRASSRKATRSCSRISLRCRPARSR